MKTKIVFTVIMLFCLQQGFSQSLTATATPTPSQCPSTGVITVNATGGTPPYTYSVFGPATHQGRSSNIFSGLPVGTYRVEVTDNLATVFTINNIVITSNYVPMNPTATAITEICGGSNTGAIKITLPSGQGKAPYTYKIVSGPTSQPDVNTSSTTHTFTNLAPGSYRVSVADNCGEVQARDVILNIGTFHNSYMKVWATSNNCTNTDYYVQPGIGTYYPHTYYAYPNGDFTQTPTHQITVNGASEMVSVPGVGAMAFKFTLPTPATFMGGKYGFKFTDACNTDLTSPRVIPNTMALGNYNITQTRANCQQNLNVILGEGWTYPVTVKATPIDGGAAVADIILTNYARTATFSGVTNGKVYRVEIQDYCLHKKADGTDVTSNITIIAAPDLGLQTYQDGGSNIDGTKNMTFHPNSGWQPHVTAKIISGPTTHNSALLGQLTTTYPSTPITLDGGGYFRFKNLAPGDYTMEFDDGCTTRQFNFTVPSTGLQQFNFPALTTSGCPGAQTLSSTASAASGGFYVDVRGALANGGTYQANGLPGGGTFTLNQLSPGTYTVYYYMSRNAGEIFKNPNDYNNNPNYTLIKSLQIVLPTLTSHPELGDYGLANCTTGEILVALYRTSNSAPIHSFSIEKTAGAGDFVTQTTNIFTLNDYGIHAYKVYDECGNEATGNIEIQPNTNPTFSSDKCLTEGDVTLTIHKQPNTTYTWIKPDGTSVIADELFIPKSTVSEKYELIAVHEVSSCSEEKRTIIITPQPTTVLNDTIVHQKPYNFTLPVVTDLVQSIAWYKDETLISGQTGETLDVTTPGEYKAVVSYGSGCLSEFTQNVSFPNYWMGGNGATLVEKENWADPLNWTNNYVPLANQTLPAQNEDVIFATVANFNQDAVNNLVLDIDRTVANVINQSPVALIVPVNKTLTVGGTATTGSAEQLILKSVINEANGALIFSNPSQNTNVLATVEFSSKSYKGGGTYPRMWQYIGSPIVSAIPTDVFGTDVSGTKYGPAASVLLRKYDESKNDPNDVGDKFIEGTSVNTAMDLFHGYEVVKPVTSPAPNPIYSFKGVLNVNNHTSNLTFTPAVYYRGNFLLANSYAAPIFIDNLKDANFSNLEQTIYIYNTGSRDEWMAAGGWGETRGSSPGQYFSIPIKAADRIAGYPLQIASMQGFMVRRLANANYDTNKVLSFTFDYNDVKPASESSVVNEPMRVKTQSNTSVSEKTKEKPLLMVDVVGSKSADRVYLLTESGTSKGFDNGWDGNKFIATDAVQIYTNHENTRYQVSTDADIDGTYLGIWAGDDAQYTLHFTMKDMDSKYTAVYIEDLATGIKQLITNNSTLAFHSLTPGKEEIRFKLTAIKKTNPQNNNANSNIDIQVSGRGNIIVTNHNKDTGIINILDVSGNLLYKHNMMTGVNTLSLKLPAGVYIIEAQAGSDRQISKSLLN